MAVDRRSSERKPARIKVRFWRCGVPDRVFTGYTSNISESGCFVQTDQPVGTAGRIQMELSSDNHGIVCEGIVARSIKAPYELRQVKPSGMGVRFLSIKELLRGLVPTVLSDAESASAALSEGDQLGAVPMSSQGRAVVAEGSRSDSKASLKPGTASAPTPDSASGGIERPQKDVRAARQASRRAGRHHPAAPPRRKTTSDAAAGRAPAAPNPPGNESQQPDFAFRIAPPTVERLASMYRRELLKDRLFIPTKREAQPGSSVRVELVLPESGGQPESVVLHGTVRKLLRKGDIEGKPNKRGIELYILPAASAKRAIAELVASGES